MSSYVYAIVGRDTPLPASRATELELVPWRRLAAVIGRIETSDTPLMEAVLHHEAVVEAVRKAGPALPVRFGTVFRDAASVTSALAQRYEQIVADLDRLGDKIELSLTALWAVPLPTEAREPLGSSAAARYLYARAAELRHDEAMKERARSAAHELDQILHGYVLEQRVSFCPTPRVALRTAYLLDAAGLDGFRDAFESIRATRADLRVLLTGPWPPYSFVRRPDEVWARAG